MKIETMDPATGRFTRAVETEGPIRIRWGESDSDCLQVRLAANDEHVRGIEVRSLDRRIVILPEVANIVRILVPGREGGIIV